MNKGDRKYILFVTFLLLGIVVALQFKSTLLASKEKTPTAQKIEELMQELNYEKQLHEELKQELQMNMMEKETFINDYLKLNNDDALKLERDNIRLKAGLRDVMGAGIIITLDDAPARQGEDPSLLIIHDSDIKIILNELKKAGAQAISINGERIVTTSEQICAGPTILINRNRYPVPYVINAIGNADEMYDSLLKNERIALMKSYNIRIDIKKQKEVFVPKFKNEIDKLISGLEVYGNENK